MIESPHVQRSPEWVAARLGLPSASNFDRIIQPSKLKPSAGQAKYQRELLCEWLFLTPASPDSSQWMQRGTMMEDEARNYYALAMDSDPRPCGLCTDDLGRYGASPDAIVGDEGLLEIKIPSAANHLGYLLDGLDAEYRCQLQGQLLVTGREWVDFLSYNPTIKPYLVRVFRNPVMIDALQAELDSFVDRLSEAKVRLVDLGCRPAKQNRLARPVDPYGDVPLVDLIPTEPPRAAFTDAELDASIELKGL